MGASRRLLVEGDLAAGGQQRTLGDPNPVCQFCELAVSYVKVCITLKVKWLALCFSSLHVLSDKVEQLATREGLLLCGEHLRATDV